MSTAALEYGAGFELHDVEALADRLYGFGRRPVSPRLRRTFPERPTLLDAVLGGRQPVQQLTGRGWRRRVLAGMSESWALWLAPGDDAEQATSSFKLYVSPALEDIGRVFDVVARALPDSGAVGVKVGADLPFLARPDKLVVYLCEGTETLRLGRELASQLRGVGGDPVPFTCPVDGSSLVSWGMDPPDTAATQESWRGWVTRRVAEAMVDTPRHHRVANVRRHMARLGVDPERWEPGDVVWSGHAAD